MSLQYLDEIDISSKKVMIRVDYNVPYDSEMNITDDTRIRATLPTLQYCLDRDCVLILVSHLGRPKGKIVESMSLAPVATRISELTGKDVRLVDEKVGEDAASVINSLAPGSIALLENIRFYPEEEKNDDDFGRKLASLADVYINDAFAASHRGHASNEAVTRHIPVCGAGFLLRNEIEYFKKALLDPSHPVTAIIGGAKVSTKIDALMFILPKIDSLIIGGAMPLTFLKAQGYETGNSLVEDEHLTTALQILEAADKNGVSIILPDDVVVSSAFDDESDFRTVPADSIPPEMEGVDVGEDTLARYREIINSSKTIIWNGPVGAFEIDSFAKGTFAVAQYLAESGALTLVGGGDTVSAVNKSGYAEKMSYISTGGGAFLELLEGKTLPAIAALER